MGLPEISVYFKEKGIAAIESAKRGIILLLLNDTSVQAVTKYTVFETMISPIHYPKTIKNN